MVSVLCTVTAEDILAVYEAAVPITHVFLFVHPGNTITHLSCLAPLSKENVDGPWAGFPLFLFPFPRLAGDADLLSTLGMYIPFPPSLLDTNGGELLLDFS